MLGWLWFKWEQRKQRQAQELAAKERAIAAQLEQHRAQQSAVKNSLDTLIHEVQHLAGGTPAYVAQADKLLDVAAIEFQEGAFAPFWDAIEQATTSLAAFDESIRKITEKVSSYKNKLLTYQGPHPSLAFAPEHLPDAAPTVEKLKGIVRQAQKDFHFATIYEQRKTNAILISGFSTLGQAIYDLGGRLDQSLRDLGSSVSELGVSITSVAADVRADLKELREDMSHESAARRAHEAKEQEMLDNIQRRKKPN